MGGFLSSILGGSNPTLNSNINQFGQDAGAAQKTGQGDVNAASTFYQDILSGDPTKQAQALAPETKAAQDQAQQAKAQTSQFGTRSGGTGGAIQGIDAQTRAQLIALLGGQQQGAAAGAASLGTSQEGLALQGKEEQDAAAQQRMQNWQNSILGKGIGVAAQGAEGAIGGMLPGGAGAAAGMQGALADVL